VISRSPTDAQPRLDAIAAALAHCAKRLNSAAFLYERRIHSQLALFRSVTCKQSARNRHDMFRATAPPRIRGRTRGVTGRDRAFRGVQSTTRASARSHDTVTSAPRDLSSLARPHAANGRVIGAISWAAPSPACSPTPRLKLLQTSPTRLPFAVENVRLFKSWRRATAH